MQTGDDRNILISTMPATSRDRRAALAVVGVSSVLFAVAVPFATVPLAAGAGVRRQLPIRAGGQRSPHRDPAVFAVHHPAVAGPVAAGERLSVHRGCRDRSRPHLSRSVRADRTARRGSPDDGLALHDLARRLSASRTWICAAPGRRWRRQDTYVDRQGNARQHHCSGRCDFRADMGRHGATRHPPDAAERRTLYADHDRRRLRGVVTQPGRDAGAVVSATAFRHRYLAHGRAVRLAVRHRLVGHPQPDPDSISAFMPAGSTVCVPRVSFWRCC